MSNTLKIHIKHIATKGADCGQSEEALTRQETEVLLKSKVILYKDICIKCLNASGAENLVWINEFLLANPDIDDTSF